MSPNRPNPNAQTLWTGLYFAGGAAALLAVLVTLTDMLISFGGGDNVPGMPVTEWFALYADNALIGMRNLGLFNIIVNSLSALLFLALLAAHRRTQPAAAALAAIVMVVGACVYAANNQALPMLALSEQYAAAGEAQRELIAAAGTALLAQGEDFTPGAYPGFFFCLAGHLLMAAALLRGGIFRRWIALTGLFSAAAMLVFTTFTTFHVAPVETMMPLALAGGLGSWAWNIAAALRLFHLARPASADAAPRSSAVRMAGEGAR